MRTLRQWSDMKVRLDRFWARHRVQWCLERGLDPAVFGDNRSIPKWDQLERLRNKIAQKSGVPRHGGVAASKRKEG